MKRRTKPNRKSATGRNQRVSAAMDSRGGAEIIGREIILHGQDAEQVRKFCQTTGIPGKVLLTEMLRVLVERWKIEKPKKIEDVNWQRYADELFKRLETWRRRHTGQIRR